MQNKYFDFTPILFPGHSESSKSKPAEAEAYLAKEVYPVLVPAIESLSREVEQIINDKDNKIDKREKNRFNPAIYLANYILRNKNQAINSEIAKAVKKSAEIELAKTEKKEAKMK